MRKLSFSFWLLKFSLTCLALTSVTFFPHSIEAQHVKMTPTIGEVFPLEEREGKVYAKYSVMINPSCIVPKGAYLRTIFVPPNADDKDVKEKSHKQKQKHYKGGRKPSLKLKRDSMSPVQRAAYDRAVNNIWEREMRFRGTLHHLELTQLFLVFESTSEGVEELRIEPFYIEEGLFLGQLGDRVVVLSVDKNSNAYKLGVRQDSVLTHVNGVDLEGSLQKFQDVFVPQREMVRRLGKPLPMRFILRDGAEAKDLEFRQPRSLEADPFG